MRPFQYMGSKLRSLDLIRDVALRLVPGGGTAIDLFTGSSTVAQSLAGAGFKVDAFDAMEFAALAAHASLGVGRTGQGDIDDLAHSILGTADESMDAAPFRPWLEWEERGLAQSDGDSLLQLGSAVPQVWRPEGAATDLSRLLQRVAAAAGTAARGVGPIASTHYAGSYLGVRQALDVDAIRRAVSDLGLSGWARSVALTSLVSAMSSAAFTAGKHFAQPHKIDVSKDLSFHRQRVLSDRAVDVRQQFRQTMAELGALQYWRTGPHSAEQLRFEDLLAGSRGPTGLLYADPPYTAQQYSRFYHVPEVIIADRVPALLQRGGTVTAGLYNTDRFKSRFCSTRKALGAFNDLLALSRRWRAPLIISYAGASAGNARMIDLPVLVRRLREEGFRGIQLDSLEHNYRQVNSQVLAVADRSDTEFVLSAVPQC